MAPPSNTDHSTGSGLALLAVLAPAILVTVIASDMVNLMLPAIGVQFGASEAELAWVVTGFLLMFSVGIPFFGRIADRLSLRRLFSLALLTYAAGSLVCALAPSLLVLVLGRVVTGVGAAAIPVLSIIAVARLMPSNRRGFGIGVISAGAGIGTAAGPALGGGIGQFFGWPALFWLTLAAALVLLPAAWRVLPGERPSRPARFDLLGGIFLGLGAMLLLFGVTQVQLAGFGAPAAWGSLLAALISIVLFAWRTASAAEPFVPPQLFANRVYRATVGVAFLAMLVNLGALVFVPLLLVDVNGLTPGEGALVMIPAGLAVAVLSPLVGRIADRIGTQPLVLAGLMAMGVAAAFLSSFAGGGSIHAGLGILGLSIGFILVMTPLISAAAEALPPDQVGIGMGLLQGAQFLGAGAGPALFGALLTARQVSGSAALNPLFAGPQGAAYSDAFLAMACVVVLALIVASRMRVPAAAAPVQGELR